MSDSQSSKVEVDLVLQQRTFSMRCDSTEEPALRAAIDLLEQEMNEIRMRVMELNFEKTLLLAAVNIATKYQDQQVTLQLLEQSLDGLNQAIDKSIMPGSSL